jgi:hypothetical protein
MAVYLAPSPPRRRGPRLWRNERSHRIDALVEVYPVRIHPFNNAEFPSSIPFLQLLFVLDRIFHRMVVLIPNKHFQAVNLRKSIERFILMIANAIPKNAGHTDIHCAPVAVRHDVNSGKFLVTHAQKPAQRHVYIKRSGAPAVAGVTEFGKYRIS